MAQSRLTLTLPVLALAFASSTLALAATVAGVEVSPPLAAQNVTEVHWGVEVSDPYRRLENVSDPEVRQWLRAQADATAAVLARIPGRKAMLDRIKEIEGAAGGTTTSVVRTDGGRLFYLRRNADENQFKLVWRDGPNGADHMVFDPEAAGQGGQPHAVMDFAPSRDGRKLAYSVQAGGGEIGTLHVIDLASGREIVSPIDRIRYASVSWLDDGSGFFYSRLREGYEKLPPTQRFGDRTRHYRALDAAGTDRAIMSPSRNPELGLPGYASPFVFQVHGTRTAAAVVVMGVDPNRMLLVADLDAARAGKAQWRKVVDTSDQVTSITESGGWFYLKSAKDAPRYKVLRMPVARPELARAELVVPAARARSATWQARATACISPAARA